MIINTLKEYISRYPTFRQVFQPWLFAIPNEQVYDALFYMTSTLPLEVMDRKAKYIGSQKEKDQVANFKRLS